MKKSGGAWVKEAREELIERIIQEIVAPRDPYKKTPGSMDEIPRSQGKIKIPKMY
jgi:hypothetical protein